ncbi:MAG: toxin-antitoxin system antitoxin subunit [Acidothermaceae bacterium]
MTTKITVSLSDEAVAAAKRAVKEGQAPSVSAYVAEALDRTYGARRPLSLLVADMIAEGGEPSSAAYRWADKALGLA